MRMHSVSALSLAAAAAGAAPATGTATILGAARCQDLTFTVPAAATNFLFHDPPDPNNATAVKTFLINGIFSAGAVISGTQNVSGTFVVGATYCQPPVAVRPRGPLQFLVHGSTYNRTVWTGLGASGDYYNYQVHAARKGYRTLAVDYLGRAGYPGQLADPTHPRRRRRAFYADPLYTVQAPLQVEILHRLLAWLRAGGSTSSIIGSIIGSGGVTADAVVHGSDQILYVAHSYGCNLGLSLTQLHPADLDGLVLTGHSSVETVGADFFEDLASAVDVEPRLAALSPPPPLGYVTMATESVRTGHFYGGAYDPAVAHYDYLYRDAATDGDSLTGISLAPTSFAGPVLVATGDQDVIFCAGPDPCADILNRTRVLYPQSPDYSYHVVANTGHSLPLHYSAPATFAFVSDWVSARFA